MGDGERAAAAQGPRNDADRALRALQAARTAAVRCPTGVWPRLDHAGATCGYEERPAAPLTLAEAAEADGGAAAADERRTAAPGGGAAPPLLKPVQQLRAAVDVMLHALEPAAADEGQRAAAIILHSADALAFARRLAAYATPWARDAGERLAYGLAQGCADAREELLAGHLEERRGEGEGGGGPAGGGGGGGGGGSAAAAAAGVKAAAPPPSAARAGPLAMVGGALISRAPLGSGLFRRAVVSACMGLDGCPDFARFCGARPYDGDKKEAPPIGATAAAAARAAAAWAPCPLARVHARLFAMPPGSCEGVGPDATATSSEELEACRDAFLLCLGRVRRSGAAGRKGGSGPQAGWLGPPPPPNAASVVPSEGFWASLADLSRLEAALVRAPAAAAVSSRPPRAAAPSTPARQQQRPLTGEGDGSGERPAPSALEAARRAWASRPLRDPLPSAVQPPGPAPSAAAAAAPPPPPPPPRLSWQQTSADVEVRLSLPAGTRARDVRVEAAAGSLAVWVAWQPGRAVVEGRLWRRVKAGDVVWTVATGGSRGGGGDGVTGGGGGGGGRGAGAQDDCELQLLLPKDEARRYWKGLFAGEEERGHLELLREAVQAEETKADAAALDAAAAAAPDAPGEDGGRGGGGGGGAGELLRQLRERQALVASGELDLRHGFDDFRLVLSDDGL